MILPMFPLAAVALAAVLAASPASGQERPGPRATGGTEAAADPATPSAADPLRPDTVLSPPGGPRLVLLGTPGSGIAALRLHVPLEEAPAEAGVGRLLEELARDRMEGLARPVGARVSVSRTPWGLAYAAEGAVADVEYLAYLLREAVRRPEVADVPFSRAKRRLAEAAARARETPSGRLSDRLRSALDPTTPPPQGTPATVAALDAGRLLEAWRRSHRPDRMTLVASAGVVPEVILAATRGLGSDGPAPPPLDAPPPTEDRSLRTQSLRRWYGRAWSGGRPASPVGPVAALLVAEALEESGGDFETTLQLRALRHRWALLALGAAYRADVPAMRAAVDGAVAGALSRLTRAGVSRAAARLRRDLLFRTRTPLGLVEAVGWAMEASGDPTAAARRLAALDTLDAETVRTYLEELAAGPAVTAEVRP
jgi:predicted Zn-dependent peptidase